MTQSTMYDGLTLLGQTVEGPISAVQIETFPAPPEVSEVTFTTDELTAFCPLTAQPDFYQMTFTYCPAGKCVESKSFKLYLQSFRQTGAFCEVLSATVLDDLVRALAPKSATVRLVQQIRGGLINSATSTYPLQAV